MTEDPATEVLAAVNGKVVATGPTGSSRPDVSAALRDPAANTSGFALSIPETRGPVALYTLNRNGTVSLLSPSNSHIAPVISRNATAVVTTPDGMAHALVSYKFSGSVDGATRQSAQEYRVTPPAGQSFGSYSWLRVSSSESLKGSTFTLTDKPSAPANHQIDFKVLPQPPRQLWLASEAAFNGTGSPEQPQSM